MGDVVELLPPTRTYDCKECGRRTTTFAVLDNVNICMTCRWLGTWVRPEDQAAVRRRLRDKLED